MCYESRVGAGGFRDFETKAGDEIKDFIPLFSLTGWQLWRFDSPQLPALSDSAFG